MVKIVKGEIEDRTDTGNIDIKFPLENMLFVDTKSEAGKENDQIFLDSIVKEFKIKDVNGLKSILFKISMDAVYDLDNVELEKHDLKTVAASLTKTKNILLDRKNSNQFSMVHGFDVFFEQIKMLDHLNGLILTAQSTGSPGAKKKTEKFLSYTENINILTDYWTETESHKFKNMVMIGGIPKGLGPRFVWKIMAKILPRSQPHLSRLLKEKISEINEKTN